MSLATPRRIFVRSSRRASPPIRRRVLAALVLVLWVVLGGQVLLADNASGGKISSAVLTPAPSAAPIRAMSSSVAVVDGATLRVGDEVVRLDGVTAPERDHSCAGAPDCAANAAQRLATLVRNRIVDCRLDRSRGGEPARGVCEADGVSLNAALAQQVDRGL